MCNSTELENSTLEARPPRVLFVDDDAKLLRGLKRALAEEPFEILTAVSAAEANALLKQERIELIVSDNLMCGTLGTEFLERVHREYPQIKLIMLSGFIPAAAANRMISECGVSRVISKPCHAQQVADAVRSELETVTFAYTSSPTT